MKRAIIVGASTGIGAEMARQLAGRRYQVVLLARSQDKLDALVGELRAAHGPMAAHAIPHDVTHTDTVSDAYAAAKEKLGGVVDLFVYNSGVMQDTEPDEFNAAKDLLVLDVNLRGAMAWLDAAATDFIARGAGTIAAVSSVAGDRGRKGHPSYHAAKAGLSTFLDSLYLRLKPRGVHVCTIKPGPIETPMTQGKEGLPPLYPVERAVGEMIAALERGCRVVYVPGKWRWIMLIIQHIPMPLFRRLPI